MKQLTPKRVEFIQSIESDPIDHKPFRVAGFVPLSTVDWPDQLAAVIFTQGCPWRCGYCHNSHLIPPRGETSFAWNTVLESITQRKDFLDGVVISGGEPLLQRGLSDVLSQIHALGLKTGLHTSGSLPKQLESILPQLDWVGLDIKATPDKYALVTHRDSSGQAAWHSLDLIIESGVDYEVRITVHTDLMSPNHFNDLLDSLAARKIKYLRLQHARPIYFDNTLPDSLLFDDFYSIANNKKNQFMSLEWRI